MDGGQLLVEGFAEARHQVLQQADLRGQGLGAGVGLPVKAVGHGLQRGLGVFELVGQQAVGVGKAGQFPPQLADGGAPGDHVVQAEGQPQRADQHRGPGTPARIRPPEDGCEGQRQAEISPRKEEGHGFFHGSGQRFKD